jgi:hypothetical protein
VKPVVEDWESQPQEIRILGRHIAQLICCHCGEPALAVSGHGAAEFAKSLTGRVVCEECHAKLKEGEDLPFRTGRDKELPGE